MCAVDLNADGLSDLLVGAPMFSTVREEGRVYVYINQGRVRTDSSRLSKVAASHPGCDLSTRENDDYEKVSSPFTHVLTTFFWLLNSFHCSYRESR